MSEGDTYRTIQNPSEGSFRDRGSKFLAFAFPVETTEEIKETLNELRKQYHDARHHCYAYRLGAEKEIYRTNDDGEPSGSAGKPILGQIKSHDLSNILIVVVRYFGGTKLGIGGLIHAYRTAAASAIQHARIITAVEQDLIKIIFPYSMMNEVMKFIREEGMKITEQEFGDSCQFKCLIRKSHASRALARFSHRKEISLHRL